MELTFEDLEDGVRAIHLAGRLDMEGADAIDLKLTSLAAVQRGFVVLDLTLVEFLASIRVSKRQSSPASPSASRCRRKTSGRSGPSCPRDSASRFFRASR